VGAKDIVILVLYSLGMSGGQVLFKLAANGARARAGERDGFLASLFGAWHFYASIALYGVLTVLWIWLLTRIPLSRAYPFVILTFVLTPALAAVLFGESLGPWYFAGLALILAGLAVLVFKAG
jgi:drug/metabolite transporter (DMT)-like permease